MKKSKLLVSRGMSDMDLFALLATIRGVHNDISGINSHFLLDSQPLDGVNMHTKQYTHRSLLLLLFVFPSRVVSTCIVCISQVIAYVSSFVAFNIFFLSFFSFLFFFFLHIQFKLVALF